MCFVRATGTLQFWASSSTLMIVSAAERGPIAESGIVHHLVVVTWSLACSLPPLPKPSTVNHLTYARYQVSSADIGAHVSRNGIGPKLISAAQ